MKKTNTLPTIVRNINLATVAAVTVFFISHPVYAQAQGLKNAGDVLTKFQTELKGIIPIAAAVILLCLAIGYAGRYIEKDTFVRWAIGVVIAGSAAEIANLLFTKA
ncbi:VirB2 family type IV secretion system major pilin TrwL [Bartonella machadoae]|uniref:VirB2 family type IV secretion system major pilin TrwL n=1 Tax=Bartonella machadoae TaxID=2893471 RepID=UPI001F4CF7A7|nr:VirB2 family type IV secretion system major pilin TrwL [Bartonella machadoae]UNE54079.1 VirB2 family type IV secretion system major pilin TrwL [Bartonella machadoae]